MLEAMLAKRRTQKLEEVPSFVETRYNDDVDGVICEHIGMVGMSLLSRACGDVHTVGIRHLVVNKMEGEIFIILDL